MKMSRMHLSRDREQTIKMHYRAMHQINEALAVCLSSTRTKDEWTCLRRDKLLELHARRQPTSMASTSLLGVNDAKCSFDEVRELLSIDSTAKFRLMMTLVHGRDVKDAGLISMRPRHDQLVDPGVPTQHAAVWFALQNRRRPALVRERAFTFFQTLRVIVPEQLRASGGGDGARLSDAIQKRTLALSWLPFPDEDEADASAAPAASDAMHLQLTLLVEELEPDRLRVSCLASSFQDANAPHASSRWAARAVARRLVLRSVARLEAAVVASRLSGQELLSPHKWVPNDERAACVICWKPFTALFRRRHHCRVCGDVVCGACSSLRPTNVAQHKALLKVRVCHLCSNKGRVKADSFASTTDTFPGALGTDEEMPLAKLFPGPYRAPRLVRDFLFQPPATAQQRRAAGLGAGAFGSDDGSDRDVDDPDDDLDDDDDDFSDDDEDEDMDDMDDDNNARYRGDGYIGRGPDSLAQPHASQKIISIRSLQRGGALAAVPAAPRTAVVASHSPAPPVVKKARSSDGVRSRAGSRASAHAAPLPRRQPPMPTLEHARRSPPLDYSRRSPPPVDLSLSFLHPAAARGPSARALQPVVADVGSYEDVRESESSSVRRTSIASSCAGLLDRYYVDEGYFLPKLDPLRELQRLQLMQVVCSPACTLIEPALMKKCCEVAASAFGVAGAFIARVDEFHVAIEHAVGTPRLRAYDQFLRHDTLCDFVLVQPPHQPIVILDCVVDPRTAGIPMVQHLGMRFFVGVPIAVRGLPVGCLCAFSCENSDEPLVTTRYDLTILENAVRSIEAELEELVQGLQLS